MYKVLKTYTFTMWLKKCSLTEKTQILARLDLASLGHFGGHKTHENIIELNWKNKKSVYLFLHNNTHLIALYGGSENDLEKNLAETQKIKNKLT